VNGNERFCDAPTTVQSEWGTQEGQRVSVGGNRRQAGATVGNKRCYTSRALKAQVRSREPSGERSSEERTATARTVSRLPSRPGCIARAARLFTTKNQQGINRVKPMRWRVARKMPCCKSASRVACNPVKMQPGAKSKTRSARRHMRHRPNQRGAQRRAENGGQRQPRCPAQPANETEQRCARVKRSAGKERECGKPRGERQEGNGACAARPVTQPSTSASVA